MKTIFKVSMLGVLVIAALAFTGFAYAGSSELDIRDMLSGTFTVPSERMNAFAFQGRNGPGDGILQEYMPEAWAEVLDITLEKMEDMLASGMTHYEIAVELGLASSHDEFFDLLQEAMAIAIANAEADGYLTPEQARVMLQHMNQMGEHGMLGRMNRFGDMQLRNHGEPFGPLSYQSGLMEEFLGLTQEQVRARVQNGETFADILAEEGKTLEEWAAFSLEAHTKRINEAVAAGQLTQQQADAWILRTQERFEHGWLEPFGPKGPIGEPGEGGLRFGEPGQHGPCDMSGPYGDPGEGGPGWGSPGMNGPGGRHGPNFTPPGLNNQSGEKDS